MLFIKEEFPFPAQSNSLRSVYTQLLHFKWEFLKTLHTSLLSYDLYICLLQFNLTIFEGVISLEITPPTF
jgi:hypothetical protein